MIDSLRAFRNRMRLLSFRREIVNAGLCCEWKAAFRARGDGPQLLVARLMPLLPCIGLRNSAPVPPARQISDEVASLAKDCSCCVCLLSSQTDNAQPSVTTTNCVQGKRISVLLITRRLLLSEYILS